MVIAVRRSRVYMCGIECLVFRLFQRTFHFESDKGSLIEAAIVVAVGGCFALVQLAKTCLEKAIKEIPNCDQVTELEGVVLILYKSLQNFGRLTLKHAASPLTISSIGTVELVVKVMKTFPKCESLQLTACNVLYDLTVSFTSER
jgi:hypothetical protein